jgi:hypothetical protein
MLKTCNVTLPSPGKTGASPGREDPTATAILAKMLPGLLEKYLPLHVLGDGNCLFRALSRAVYGHEDHHLLIRLLTALEIAEYPEVYDPRQPDFVDLLHDRRLPYCHYQETLRAACSLGAYTDIVHVLAASAVLGQPITSHHPAASNEHLVAWSRRVTGRGVKDRPTPVRIMWSSMTVPERTEEFRANHFVVLHPLTGTEQQDTVHVVNLTDPAQWSSLDMDTTNNFDGSEVTVIRGAKMDTMNNLDVIQGANNGDIDCEVSGHEGSDSDTPRGPRSRKRQCDPDQSKRAIRQRRCNLGQSYVSSRNKPVKAKHPRLRPCHCKRKCSEKITDNQRRTVFSEYWNTGSYERQREFIIRCVEEQMCKTRRSYSPVRCRPTVRSYYLPVETKRERVCQEFFLDTFDIGKDTVGVSMKKKLAGGTVTPDMRGKRKKFI